MWLLEAVLPGFAYTLTIKISVGHINARRMKRKSHDIPENPLFNGRPVCRRMRHGFWSAGFIN